MAKINIPFDGKSYSIDESTLASVSPRLQLHLERNMNGEGAVINFGGTAYAIDAAKLSDATSKFVFYLSTITGSGSEVEIGGTKYSIDSTKTSDAVDNLHSRFENLQDGRVSDIVPGLYETGTHYTVMIKPWKELIEEGVIHVEDGVLRTNENLG